MPVLETEKMNIQASLAVLASSSRTRDKQFDRLEGSLSDHILSEDRLFEKIFDRAELDRKENAARFSSLETKQAKSEGAVTGGKLVLTIISIVTSLSLFLGFKGLK